MSKSNNIGVVPNSGNFKHPGDRRRYLYYFMENDIQFEIADFNKSYDILYLTLSADLAKWSKYKIKNNFQNKHSRIIFDLSDSYLNDFWLKNILRSFYYFLSGKSSVLYFSYKNLLLEMLGSSDVVLCTSVEQKKELDLLHNNVIVAKDNFLDDIILKKQNYCLSNKNELNILWEGFSHGNLKIFEMIRMITDTIIDYKINLHFITDSDYCKIGTSTFCTSTYSVLKEVFKNSNVNINVYNWNSLTFSSIATKCDIAIIPIPDDPVMKRKPENKLILLWTLGIPVVASRTSSYDRVMKSINQDFLCDDISDWNIKINELANSKEIRERYMSLANIYLENQHSRNSILKIWERVFFSR